MNRLIVLIALCIFVAPPATGMTKSNCHKHRYYKYNSISNETAFIFDTKYDNVFIGNKNIKDSQNISSDIGGAFEKCSNSDFYCWKSLLVFLVPKHISSSTWIFKGNYCSSTRKDDAKYYMTICMSHEGLVTKFTYSKKRGIISFQSLIPKDSKYVISGSCGLFFYHD